MLAFALRDHKLDAQLTQLAFLQPPELHIQDPSQDLASSPSACLPVPRKILEPRVYFGCPSYQDTRQTGLVSPLPFHLNSYLPPPPEDPTSKHSLILSSLEVQLLHSRLEEMQVKTPNSLIFQTFLQLRMLTSLNSGPLETGRSDACHFKTRPVNQSIAHNLIIAPATS